MLRSLSILLVLLGLVPALAWGQPEAPPRTFEVEVVNARGDVLGEFDEIDLNNRLLFEDKEARGLDRINPRTGRPALTVDEWAEKQLFNKTVTRITNLKLATATRASARGSTVVPSLDEVRSLRALVFRIEGDTPALRGAVENQLGRLRSSYPGWRFNAEFGAPGGSRAAPPSLTVELEGRLAEYRRADGTLRWKPLLRDGALHEGGRAAHFAMALFLKELANVASTGDRARIEELFDGLASTDFFVEYGLFSLGARAGEVAWSRYLERYVRPRFVSGVLKTNLVLATGLALPALVRGRFEGKAFAISLASLGLSSTTVRVAVAGIAWVKDLASVSRATTAARVGAGASRLARAGGWFYTAAELAVVLYLSEAIEERVHAHLDRSSAREGLANAGLAFVGALGDPIATPESVREASEAYHDAWTDYRDFLYRPLHEDEALYAQRLEKLARRAKLLEDERDAALERALDHPALRGSLERRYGSLEGWARQRAAEDERKLGEELDVASKSFQAARERHLAEIYDGKRRGRDPLAGLPNVDWLLTGARIGAANDPLAGRTDVFASWGRVRRAAALADALGDASENRLETYEDEARILARAASALRAGGRGDLAGGLSDALARVERTRLLDDRLIHGSGPIDLSPGSSVVEALEGEAR